jgi:hypothetical protein
MAPVFTKSRAAAVEGRGHPPQPQSLAKKSQKQRVGLIRRNNWLDDGVDCQRGFCADVASFRLRLELEQGESVVEVRIERFNSKACIGNARYRTGSILKDAQKLAYSFAGDGRSERDANDEFHRVGIIESTPRRSAIPLPLAPTGVP